MKWRLKPGEDFDFMGLRYYFIGASLVLLAISAIFVVKPGLRFGTDFLGGTEVEVAFSKDTTAAQIREAVTDVGFKAVDVVSIADDEMPNRYLVRVKEITSLSDQQQAEIRTALCLVPEEGQLEDPNCPEPLRTQEVKVSPGGDKVSARYLVPVCIKPAGGDEMKADAKCLLRQDVAKQLTGKVTGVELRGGENNPLVQNPRENRVEFYLKSKGDQIMDGLRQRLGADAVPAAPLRVEWIGPKAGDQLRDAAITSILIAVIFIMVYIAFRFDMRFAPGAVVALLHDVGLATGAMAIAQREITLSTVAALLTIVGYSINDTVVVYDRIRENLGKYRKMTFPKIINRSVTEMIGRTIRTSITTALAIIAFMFLGTGVIKDFAFTLLIGVVFGTYSSIYIAAPVTEWIDRRFFTASVKKRRRVRRKKKPGGPGGRTPGSKKKPAAAVP